MIAPFYFKQFILNTIGASHPELVSGLKTYVRILN